MFGEFVFVAAEWSSAGCVADDKDSTVTYPDPVRVSVVDFISAPATFARHGGALRPIVRAGRKGKPDCGEFVVRGVAVDATTLGIRTTSRSAAACSFISSLITNVSMIGPAPSALLLARGSACCYCCFADSRILFCRSRDLVLSVP
jgi:hypothetical protein